MKITVYRSKSEQKGEYTYHQKIVAEFADNELRLLAKYKIMQEGIGWLSILGGMDAYNTLGELQVNISQDVNIPSLQKGIQFSCSQFLHPLFVELPNRIKFRIEQSLKTAEDNEAWQGEEVI